MLNGLFFKLLNGPDLKFIANAEIRTPVLRCASIEVYITVRCYTYVILPYTRLMS